MKNIISRTLTEPLTGKHIEIFSLKIYSGQHKNSRFIFYIYFPKYLNIKYLQLYRPQVCIFIKKETLVHVFSCEFCEIFKNTYFTEHLWTKASVDTFGHQFSHMQQLSLVIVSHILETCFGTIWPILYSCGQIRLQIFCALAITSFKCQYLNLNVVFFSDNSDYFQKQVLHLLLEKH